MKQTKVFKLRKVVQAKAGSESVAFSISSEIVKASAYLARTHTGFIARADRARSRLKDGERGVLAGPLTTPRPGKGF